MNIKTSKQNSNNITKLDSIQTQSCLPNRDTMYNRRIILNRIALTLTESIPEYTEKVDSSGFYVSKDERTPNFTVKDLTDSLNVGWNFECIDFINKHTYIVFPRPSAWNFIHVFYLQDGNLIYFRSINCDDRGDSLEDATNFLKREIKDSRSRKRITKRISQLCKHSREYLSSIYMRLECLSD